MSERVLVIGVDCLGPEVLAPDSLAELPALRGLVARGLAGPLRSTDPAITVPAWTAMLSGRDPGELGVYGFRNRRSYHYGDWVYATSRMVRAPRIWDAVGAAGRDSIVVGVPQTWPPPPIRGALVAGFEADPAAVAAGARFTAPPELGAEVEAVVGPYAFDADGFRTTPREAVLARLYDMTARRFDLMEHLLATRPWTFAMLCEIATDRLHHCFWSDHDPTHPRHDPASPHRDTIRRFYRFVDDRVGRLLEAVGPDVTVLLASDHGAQPMQGGVCVNDVLRDAGWLVLHEAPDGPTPFDPALVDWSRTRAWAAGGYYARVFLNLEGREPRGIVRPADRAPTLEALVRLLSTIALPGGPTLYNRVRTPGQLYRRVRGLAPDLLVFFAGMGWRSLGSVGHPRPWTRTNDTGLDEANHSPNGLYVLAGAGVAPGRRGASILDVAPTLLTRLGLTAPSDLTGRDLLAPTAPWADGPAAVAFAAVP